MDSESGRVRAWVLVRSEDAKATSKALAAKYYDEERGYEFGKGGDELVVVRADVVDGEMNLIVPVDAANGAILKEFERLLRAEEGVTEISVLRVLMHNPKTPHKSSTFITEEEYQDFKLPEFDPPGRHPRSPGANAWG